MLQMQDHAQGSGPEPHVAQIYRYPVKGLTPEALKTTTVREGETLANDRIYAIENGTGKFDPTAPRHLPKINFLMLMRDEKLATLNTRFDDDTHDLTIAQDGEEVARGNLKSVDGRAAIEDFMERFMASTPGSRARGTPRIVQADGHTFSDVPAHCLHIVNLESVRALETIAGAKIHPLRFRANIYIDGLPAWAEFDWLDKRIALGGATLNVWSRTVRCEATNVDPETGARDMSIPSLLMRTFGHQDFGVYASVRTSGDVSIGDRVQLDG